MRVKVQDRTSAGLAGGTGIKSLAFCISYAKRNNTKTGFGFQKKNGKISTKLYTKRPTFIACKIVINSHSSPCVCIQFNYLLPTFQVFIIN